MFGVKMGEDLLARNNNLIFLIFCWIHLHKQSYDVSTCPKVELFLVTQGP